MSVELQISQFQVKNDKQNAPNFPYPPIKATMKAYFHKGSSFIVMKKQNKALRQ